MPSLFLILFSPYLSASFSSKGLSFIVNQTPPKWDDLLRNKTLQQKKKENVLCLTFIFGMATLVSELLKRNTCTLKLSIQGITVIIQFTYSKKRKGESIL